MSDDKWTCAACRYFAVREDWSLGGMSVGRCYVLPDIHQRDSSDLACREYACDHEWEEGACVKCDVPMPA